MEHRSAPVFQQAMWGSGTSGQRTVQRKTGTGVCFRTTMGRIERLPVWSRLRHLTPPQRSFSVPSNYFLFRISQIFEIS